ncbi:MAG: type 1 glutamine amidotransferase domain-containing protein [Rhizomicrobium sp.]
MLKTLGLAVAALLSLQTASAASIPATASKGEVLVILSSEHTLALTGGKTLETGYYLNEFGVPADRLIKAGYKLVLVTPKGNTPVVDPGSLNARYFGGNTAEMQRIKTELETLPDYTHPKSLAQVLAGDMSHYKALLIPGGHAPMIDLSNDPAVGQLLTYFHQSGKPTAAICHGPTALLSGQGDPKTYEAALDGGQTPVAKNWIYAGYRMTVFSTAEEKIFEQSLNGTTLLYYPQAALAQAGGAMDEAAPWQSHVVVDRELITGQNPFSDEALAQALLAKLAQ